MHNCKATRERLIEQALEKTPPNQEGPLLAEIERCPACREEFASLRSVLRVTDQAMQAAQPEESFWSDYHERLRQTLESASTATIPSRSQPRIDNGLQAWLRKLVTASVPVPVPLAAVLVMLFCLSLIFAMNSRRSSKGSPGLPSVVTRTVEVPVIHERTVTRVVYRDRSSGTSRGKTLQPGRANSNAIAVRRSGPAGGTPISLVGFKPANEVKLTIIKGSYRDEK